MYSGLQTLVERESRERPFDAEHATVQQACWSSSSTRTCCRASSTVRQVAQLFEPLLAPEIVHPILSGVSGSVAAEQRSDAVPRPSSTTASEKGCAMIVFAVHSPGTCQQFVQESLALASMARDNPPAARRPQCAVKWDRNLKPKLAIMRQCTSVTDRRTDRRTDGLASWNKREMYILHKSTEISR